MGSYGETAVGLYGIDVGEMQGNINWEQVKKEGVQFAMLRSGYGAGSMDVQFRKNAEGVRQRENSLWSILVFLCLDAPDGTERGGILHRNNRRV